MKNRHKKRLTRAEKIARSIAVKKESRQAKNLPDTGAAKKQDKDHG